MSEDKRHDSQEVLQQSATAVELLRLALELVGSAFKKVRDRDSQRECFTANDLIFTARNHILKSHIIPIELHEIASARIMIEQIKTWRNMLEELTERRRDSSEGSDPFSLLDLFPKDFIDKLLDLARDAECLEDQLRKMKIGKGQTVI